MESLSKSKRRNLAWNIEHGLEFLIEANQQESPDDYECKSAYSCNAIWYALEEEGNPIEIHNMVNRAIASMGLDRSSMSAFEDIESAEERQMARAIWITWVALMVKENGIDL